MKRKSQPAQTKGFTLIEVLVVIAMVGIMTLGAGVLLANGQKSWGQLFGRVYGDSAIDSFAVQKAFDTVCRKASFRKYVLSEAGDSLELYYWDSASTASTPEHYARFYLSNEEVFVEYGTAQTGAWQPDTSAPVTTMKLAGGVESLTFTVEGTSVQMFLSYIDETMMPVVCSSVRHND
jgi:prepilin-type N-terminal cleavage/methylation domain-containing protein